MNGRLTDLAASTVAALVLSVGVAAAAPGDVHRVSAERLNLRAGPSDDDNVRSQILRGEEVVELRRSGNWLGVRTLRTGEEGWVFSELLEPVSTSTLETTGTAPATAGFGELSRDFDRLMATVDERRGFSLFDRVRQDGSSLEVTASETWLRAGSADEHTMSALAVYQMWKNHQNGAPVKVVMLDHDGKAYVTIDETGGAEPLLSVASGDG
jgi:SH3-like domain-containing protein